MKTLQSVTAKQPDCAATVSRVVKTVDGAEVASVNYATGEVRYGVTECVDAAGVNELLEDAGYDLDESVE